MNEQRMRIEICGSIASGKTTLTNLLEREGSVAAYEKYNDNPFIKDFYLQNGVNNVFETEAVFTLLHYNLIKGLLHSRQDDLEQENDSRIVVSDFSLYQDYCYSLNNLSREELTEYLMLYRYLQNCLGEPSLVIYLQCSVGCMMKRISLRGREEEMHISSDYVRNVDRMLRNHLYTDIPENRLLIIDSEEYNFLSNTNDQQFIISEIQKKLSEVCA